MSRTVRHPLLAAGVTGLLAISAVAVAASASAAPAVAPRWRITASVKTGDDGVFTAVVATGKTTGWAFDGLGLTAPTAAYRLSGSTWKKASFPGKKNEEVITAAATSPTDVWAFTQGFSAPSRVLHYNGRAWSVVKTFSDEIGDATVLDGPQVVRDIGQVPAARQEPRGSERPAGCRRPRAVGAQRVGDRQR